MASASRYRSRRAAAVVVAASAVVSLVRSCTPTVDPAPSPVGSWGAQDEREPHLTFTEDGRVSGTDGCNVLRGHWAIDGDAISFDDVVSTRKACPDVDTWLSELDTARLDRDTMHILDDSGEEIGTLERATAW